jgi:FeS assembly SUF system regulator
MLRITRQADYAIVLATSMALDRDRAVHNARDLAEATHLPQPTVTKVLKTLARAGLLVSQRGVKGGYRLARRPEEISLAEVVAALDGPLSLTHCAEHGGRCALETHCPSRRTMLLVDRAVRESLAAVTLWDATRGPGSAAGR